MSGLKVYKASAGSGKTYTLALEYIKELLLKPSVHAHRQILAVTFTKDATGEMKDRILAELYGLAFACKDSEGFLASVRNALEEAGHPLSDEQIQAQSRLVLQRILHDYSRLYITTIDSFFQKVLRNLARELGKGSRFNLEMNTGKVLTEAVAAMIEKADENEQLLNWLTDYMEDKLDKGENWRIENSVRDFSKCIFNEYFQEHENTLKKQLDDNPGIFRQLWEEHNKKQNQYKDFFKKTNTEINELLESEGLETGDFSRGGTTIKFFRKLAEGDIAGADPNAATVKECRTNPAKWASAKTKRAAEIENLAEQQLMPLLEKSINAIIGYNTSRMITDNLYQLGLIWDITKEISRLNEENNRFMLADTALFLNKMIDNSDASFVYEKIGGEIRHIMIDEFQDTSRIQWKNLRSLLSNILAENNFSMIVGDVKQSIYRWRNGDWSILNGIERELNVDSHTLDYNYRSEKNIIGFNNKLFTYASGVMNVKYYEVFDKESTSPFLSVYNRKDVEQKSRKITDDGFVSVDFIPDKTDEGKYNELVLARLLQQLEQLHQTGISAEDICILTRTNQSIINIAAYLAEKREEYPALAEANFLNVVSNDAFQFASSPTVRIIIEALKVLADPDNAVHKAQLQVFVNKYTLRSESNLTHILQEDNASSLLFNEKESLNRMPLFELIGRLYRLFKLEKISGQSSYLFSFFDATSNYLRDYSADIRSFLNFWDEDLHNKTIPSGTGIRGIRAMTIHKSKGLQFDTVLIPYCDWDLYPDKNPVVWCPPKPDLYDLELMPVKYSQKMYETVFLPEYEQETGQAWVDNLNILYVAFTRAERNLMVIAKQKKKLVAVGDIKTVSDLLRYSITETEGSFDEDEAHFENGLLSVAHKKKEAASDNVLKADHASCNTTFVSEEFDSGKSLFIQSNKSKSFIHSDEEHVVSRNEYIENGNIMHALFSLIKTVDDIRSAVGQLVFSGVIPDEKTEEYVQAVTQAISNAKVEDWFSNRYRIYNECAVIVEENGTVTHKQPDRVMMNDKETIVVDYKFGEPSARHQKQLREYTRLMQQMNYPEVKAYIWYVKKNLCTFVAANP